MDRASGVPRNFERGGAYSHNQIRLVGNIFQLSKKDLQFESVSVLSIFLINTMISKKWKGLRFESVSDFSY